MYFEVCRKQWNITITSNDLIDTTNIICNAFKLNEIIDILIINNCLNVNMIRVLHTIKDINLYSIKETKKSL